MSPALMCTRRCLCAFQVEFLFIPTMTLRDRWLHLPLRAVEMKLREASELVWGHTASEVGPDLPRTWVILGRDRKDLGGVWVFSSRVYIPLKAMTPVSEILLLCLICQASESGNGLVRGTLGPCMAAEDLGDQDRVSKKGDSGMDLVAHKSQTLVRPLHGKRISLDCRTEEKDPGEDEGVEG